MAWFPLELVTKATHMVAVSTPGTTDTYNLLNYRRQTGNMVSRRKKPYTDVVQKC